ncbi:MAG: very short patch repair endonuclease [Waddliaceae bacterium]
MADTFSPEQRSRVMSKIRSGNTSPEKTVRSYLHARGYRFRLHRKGLPERPNIILPRFQTVVFVHGCFWHQCPLCKGGRLPKSNLAYWEAKLKKNQDRDKKNIESLGWRVIVIWECQIDEKSIERLVVQKLKAGWDPGKIGR